MKKNVLMGLLSILFCNVTFAYLLIGEGHVDEPIIISNGISNFQVIENPVLEEQVVQFNKRNGNNKSM